ncbi:MAG: hypothetical protein K0R31_1862 [Clostridiales bacterium]|nr:hypothetical protein [Clostridiales bacterium]
MKRTEKAEIILRSVDEAYSIPSYLEEDVRLAIVKAIVIIEREEAQDET